jgi:hypothetical protein
LHPPGTSDSRRYIASNVIKGMQTHVNLKDAGCLLTLISPNPVAGETNGVFQDVIFSPTAQDRIAGKKTPDYIYDGSRPGSIRGRWVFTLHLYPSRERTHCQTACLFRYDRCIYTTDPPFPQKRAALLCLRWNFTNPILSLQCPEICRISLVSFVMVGMLCAIAL